MRARRPRSQSTASVGRNNALLSLSKGNGHCAVCGSSARDHPAQCAALIDALVCRRCVDSHQLGARTSPSACGRDARDPGSRDCRSGLVKTRPPSPRRVGSAHHACPELVEVAGQSPTYNCALRQAQDRLIAPYTLGARTSPSACGRDARSPGSRDCRSGLVKTRPPSPRIAPY